MLLFGQGQERLGEHFKALRVHADLPGLGPEHKALYADDVADVEILLIGGVRLFADVLAGDVELDGAVAVLDVRKGSLAHDAAGHEPPGERDRLALVRGKARLDARGTGVDGIFHLFVGIFSLGLQLL